MKKFLVVLFLFVTVFAYSFNYENYQEMPINELIKIVETAAEENTDGSLTIFDTFIGLPVTLDDYPSAEKDKKYEQEIWMFTYWFKMPENFFGSVITNKLPNGYELVMVFQNSIGQRLKDDVKKGEKIGVYAFLGGYDSSSKRISIMVSAFNTKADYKRQNVKPIWERM